MSVTGHPGQPPVKVSVPITDLNAGLFTAYGILAAYVNRLKTGKGQHVDSSLMEAGVAYTMWESAIYFTTGRSPGPNGSAHQISAPYQALPVSDGYITVGGANQRNWERFCRTIDRTDLISDPRFENNAGRMANRPALEEELGKTLKTQPAANTGSRYSKRQAYRADRSTTCRRCTPTRRSSRGTWSSRSSTRLPAPSATSASR